MALSTMPAASLAIGSALQALACLSVAALVARAMHQRPGNRLRAVGWALVAFSGAAGLAALVVLVVLVVLAPLVPPGALAPASAEAHAQAGGWAWVAAGCSAISMVAALALWPLIAKAAAGLPSIDRLQQAVDALEAEARRRQASERDRLDLERDLAATLTSLGAGFVGLDRQGRVLRMNAVAETVTGWSAADALGRPVGEVLVPEPEAEPPRSAAHAAGTANPIDTLVAAGCLVEPPRRLVVRSRRGERSALLYRAALSHDAEGRVRGMAMVFQDLSPLVQAQADANRLAAIVASSSDAIVGKTLDGRITSWNHAATRLFGYEEAEALGQAVQMLLPPERLHEEMAILTRLARGVTVPPFETQRRAKDGRLLDVSVTISPIRDGLGRIVGASKIARDISTQRKAEQARQTAERLAAENRQMQASTRLKSQFLANMSHELRTPLNAVIGFADLLQTGAVPPGSPKHAQFLGHIASSGRHLLQLINGVLDLSKVEAGKFEFHPQAMRLQPVLDEVLSTLHGAARGPQAPIALAIDPSLDTLWLDESRLKQVLFNYLSNALKFTPASGQVRVRALALGAPGARRLRLEVEDTGVGIAADDLPRLFVEFQQLEAGHAKHHQGTGLGLAITRRLVEAQGGSVGVRSRPGEGSCFWLELPCSPPADPPADSPAAAASPAPPAPAARTTAHALAAHAPAPPQDVADPPGPAITLDLLLPTDEAAEAGRAGAAAARPGLAPAPGAPMLRVTVPSGHGLALHFAIAPVLAKPLRHAEVQDALATLRQGRSRPPRVMVIDDDAMARDLMRATLAAAGATVTCCQDGASALALLDEHRPDAIVLDLMLPGMDGFAVLDALMALPRWRHTPVLIWTSLTLSADDHARLAQAAAAVLRKGDGALAAVFDTLARWPPRLVPVDEP